MIQNDMIGQKYNMLTVLEYVGRNKDNAPKLRCLCDCGKETIALAASLRNNHSKSCGCYKISNKLTHGESSKYRVTDLYKLWAGIKRRCNNKNEKNYDRYGGRGINICEEWSNDYTKFRDWAIQNGYKKGITIDRINNDEGYNPINCRFITMAEQARNKRNNIYALIGGKKKCIAEWAHEFNLKDKAIYSKISKGYTPEMAIYLTGRMKNAR